MTELKFFDTDVAFTVDATAEIPATGQLALIPQGDTASSRDGNTAFLMSLEFNGYAYLTPGAGGATQARLLTVLDTQTNGAAPTVSDANTGIITKTDITTAMPVIFTEDRFSILDEQVLVFNPAAGVTGALSTTTIPLRFEIPLNFEMKWDAAFTDGRLSTIRSNNLFFVAGSDGASDDTITVNGTARIRFFDDK